jgi:hypothetical protein
MNITKAIRDYKESGNYFAPDYERDNEVLSQFKTDSPQLSLSNTEELIAILKNSSNWDDKFFVADLLYLYDLFDIKLLDPLLENAIAFSDPSFNRIFLKPCLRVFGSEMVSNLLAEKFIAAEPIRKVRISSLVYWIEREDDSEIKNLQDAIIDRASNTNNIIELYYYNRYFPDKVGINRRIPNNAEELITCIKGNPELEDFLFNKLGWTKPNTS